MSPPARQKSVSASISLARALRPARPPDEPRDLSCSFPNAVFAALANVAWEHLGSANLAFKWLTPRMRQTLCRYLVLQLRRTGQRILEDEDLRFAWGGSDMSSLASLAKILR